jgi:hypothetical protein
MGVRSFMMFTIREEFDLLAYVEMLMDEEVENAREDRRKKKNGNNKGKGTA